MENTDNILQFEHISVTFGTRKVLSDVSLNVKRGEFLTILGPSGCGKTTMLRMLAGLLKPDSGVIRMDGKDISSVPSYKRPMNTVFQSYALFPHLNVYDNVAFGLKMHHVKEDEIDQRVVEALKMVGMEEYEDSHVGILSGGQQQRVAIARAIVNRPQVLLLDEPLSALDMKLRKEMQLELMRMHKELGITFIFVTHDQEEALTMSDTVVVMNHGNLQQVGRPIDIYNEPVNTFVADFIGESNIIEGTMLDDLQVEFLGKQTPCVDKGFGKNAPVHVIIRPEDVVLSKNPEEGLWQGVVRTCTFKGIHYEMYVEMEGHYMLQVQDYQAQTPDSCVGISIDPDNLHVIARTVP